MHSQNPNDTEAKVASTSLSELYQLAIAAQLPIVMYRLPGEQEPITMLQTDGTALFGMLSSMDAIGMTGFLVEAWKDAINSPTLLIQPQHTFHGWHVDLTEVNVITKHNKPLATEQVPLPESIDQPYEQYESQLKEIQAQIANGVIEKAILSRIVSHALPTGFDAVNAFKNAAEKYPNAFCYLLHVPGVGQWMGASPEVLVIANGKEVKTVALAGTMSDKQLKINEIEWTGKEIHEHELVSNRIKDLLTWNMENMVADGPKTIKAGNLYHLRTDFTAQFRHADLKHELQSFISALHPSPAISGWPTFKAMQVIKHVEQHQRDYYAGLIGPIAGDQASLFVNLRCMRILPDKALLYVGGGITAGSVAEDEWQETNAKAETLLNVLVC